MKKKIFPLLIVFVMCFAGVLALQIFLGRLNTQAMAEGSEQYEGLFQSERYTTADGALIRLKDVQAPVVVVTFWASWCLPCVAEFKELQRFQKRFSNEQIFFFGINQDEKDAASVIAKFHREFELNFSSIEDVQGMIAKKYSVEQLPTSFIFVRGRFVKRVDGPIEFNNEPWESWLK